ncbi:MAG: acetylxylan esterase [Phycisphaerae bacterium]|nr:acetylxylan esterase [Phycisphaerae bacterium]
MRLRSCAGVGSRIGRVGFLACIFGFIGIVAADPGVSSTGASGLWDLKRLYQAPKFEVAGQRDGLEMIYYEGEPFRGKPTRVFAYYGHPKGVAGKVPAMALVHGGGGEAFPQWVQLWVDRGYAALAMDLAGCGPSGAKGERMPDGGPGQSDVFKFRQMNLGLREQWTYHAVAAVIRGVSFLASRPEVDADRIGITGISWGGYLTCIVSGVDGRLKVSVPVYGCGFLNDNSAWVKILGELPADERKSWIKHFDPSRYLSGCRMPMLFVNGTNDFAYPLDSYQKSYRLVHSPRTLCVTVKMPHSHPAGWAPKEIGLFVDQHLKRGTALARFTKVQREGSTINALFSASEPIVKAQLHTTTDQGAWQKREWVSVPLEIVGDRVEGKLPEKRPIVWFVTIQDGRGATVSTEHEVVSE